MVQSLINNLQNFLKAEPYGESGTKKYDTNQDILRYLAFEALDILEYHPALKDHEMPFDQQDVQAIMQGHIFCTLIVGSSIEQQQRLSDQEILEYLKSLRDSLEKLKSYYDIRAKIARERIPELEADFQKNGKLQLKF